MKKPGPTGVFAGAQPVAAAARLEENGLPSYAAAG